MKKTASVSAAIFLAAFGCTAKQQQQTTQPQQQNKQNTATQIVNPTYQGKEAKHASTGYSADILYPVISGLQKTDAQFDANSKILALVTATDKQTSAEAADPMNDSQYTLNIDFSQYQLTQHTISFLFKTTSYTGGAHDNYTTQTFNYDVDNQKQIQLKDFFTPGSNYLSVLSQLARADLKSQFKKQNVPDVFLNDGTAAKEENFQSVAIGDRGLVFFFDPYQVASYADGAFQVTVPYEKLNSVLNPQFKVQIPQLRPPLIEGAQ